MCTSAVGRTRSRGTYHFVDSFDNSQHFLVANLSISIDVIQLESPIQLVFHLTPGRDTQSTDELLEIDGSTVVGIEHFEHIIRKRRWVTEWKELSIDLLEFFFCQGAGRAILQEACD